ncbi:MAG: helix-turn-helix domain-containing protein [Hyphomicrobiales bacterium]|nr:helix-turn-helix domain-containing protein [Hyphomicrobiales bacterium]
MLRTQIAAAIGCARANALDEIMREVWTHYSAGQLSEEDAGQLSALAQERRAAWQGSGQVALALVFPPPAARCPTPVRRRSHFKGRSEGRIWRPTTRKDVQQVLEAAKKYERAERQKGERYGPLGSVAIEVLEYFVNLVDFRTGRLEPSIVTIMSRVKRSRNAVVQALKALRQHGFLDWLRRYEPTGNEGRGPQVQQANNAYRLSLPEKARQLLGRFGKAPPPPADHGQDQRAWAEAIDAYKKTLPLDERTQIDAGDGPLGKALANLAKSFIKRESSRETESLSDLYLSMKT